MKLGSETILKLAPYFSIISNTPGRIRYRISPSIKNIKNELNLDEINNIISKINGIISVKFNKLIGSVTILYDEEKIPQTLWEDIVKGDNLDFVLKKLEEIT